MCRNNRYILVNQECSCRYIHENELKLISMSSNFTPAATSKNICAFMYIYIHQYITNKINTRGHYRSSVKQRNPSAPGNYAGPDPRCNADKQIGNKVNES